MESLLNEISKIRNFKSQRIDYNNTNRYRVICIEDDGSRTAYYFNTPIYNVKSRKMLDMEFMLQKNEGVLIGSNAEVRIYDNNVDLKSDDGFCHITMPSTKIEQSKNNIKYTSSEIYPTTNGIAIKFECVDSYKAKFKFKVDPKYRDIRENKKYYAIMKDKFTPLVIFSSIGALGKNGQIISPAYIKCEKMGECEYQIEISAVSQYAENILVEINMHEKKMFLDTTVESKNPTQNNSFGTIAFIGNGNTFGEQWLYSRPEMQYLNELNGHSIRYAYMYYPEYNNSEIVLSAHIPLSRFCSMGSNWNNKKLGSKAISESECINGYQKIDISNTIILNKKMVSNSEGIILKSKEKNSGFSVISTSDSCYAPPILAINYL